MSMSNAEETAILNHQYRTATYAKPTNRYVALCTADPGETGTIAEVSYTGYARVAVACADASWAAPADDGAGNMEITNAAAITFPDATSDANAPATHFAVMTASSGGSVVDYGALGTPRTIMTGDTAISFAAGELSIKRG
jgi:hypothetical protein